MTECAAVMPPATPPVSQVKIDFSGTVCAGGMAPGAGLMTRIRKLAQELNA